MYVNMLYKNKGHVVRVDHQVIISSLRTTSFPYGNAGQEAPFCGFQANFRQVQVVKVYRMRKGSEQRWRETGFGGHQVCG